MRMQPRYTKVKKMTEIGKIYDELLKRGIPFHKCPMIIEAIYSSAIEGAKIPSTSKEWDYLIELLKETDKK